MWLLQVWFLLVFEFLLRIVSRYWPKSLFEDLDKWMISNFHQSCLKNCWSLFDTKYFLSAIAFRHVFCIKVKRECDFWWFIWFGTKKIIKLWILLLPYMIQRIRWHLAEVIIERNSSDVHKWIHNNSFGQGN